MKPSRNPLGSWHFEQVGVQRLWSVSKPTLIVLCYVIALSLLVLGLVAIWWLSGELLSFERARTTEAIKALLPILAAIFGVPLVIWRLWILTQQNTIASDKTQIDRETQYTSIFAKAVEQLGATREHKQARDQRGSIETVSRTVPSIEIRLGGIHSLTRLSEESDKDAVKIEDMLLSYIRENSWYDRESKRTQLPPLFDPSEPSQGWALQLTYGSETDNTHPSISKWRSEVESFRDEILDWSKETPDSRVDVAEAIRSLGKIGNIVAHSDYRVFEECLFVGRTFDSNILRSSMFIRCAFVRCTFVANSAIRVNIQASILVRCSIYYDQSELIFLDSTLTDTSFEETSGSTLRLTGSNIFKSNLKLHKSSYLYLTRSCMYKTTIYGRDKTSLILRSTQMVRNNLSNLVLTDKSHLVNTCFPFSTFTGSDLSQASVQHVSFDYSSASAGTLHNGSTRPAEWRPYDPDGDEDDIPF